MNSPEAAEHKLRAIALPLVSTNLDGAVAVIKAVGIFLPHSLEFTRPNAKRPLSPDYIMDGILWSTTSNASLCSDMQGSVANPWEVSGQQVVLSNDAVKRYVTIIKRHTPVMVKTHSPLLSKWTTEY